MAGIPLGFKTRFIGATLLLFASLVTGCASTNVVEYDFNAMLQPVPLTAKWADTNYNIWCGSAVKGDDGKYHLFYSRWPRKLGHQAWASHSEIAHAVSDTPFGPWTHHDVTLPARGTNFWDGSCTHNPTILRIGKKYFLYYMGNYGDGVVTGSLNWTHRNHQRIGVAVADSPSGPWQRFDKPIVDISSDTNAPDALLTSNPSVAQRPDGGVLMVYKAVAKKGKAPFGGPVSHLVATADNPTGPFTKLPGEVFGAKGVMFAAEDPFIWRGANRYWAIVKDNDGNFTQRGYSLALWESADGFDWKLSKHPFVANPGTIHWANGHEEKLTVLERPQLVFENGEPVALCCASANNKSRDGSFNVQIPVQFSRREANNASIAPGLPWHDTDGVHINAHGFGILSHEGKYYWYGAHKIAGKTEDEKNEAGVRCYVSTDLLNWTNAGLVLDVFAPGMSPELRDAFILDRPKVIYHAATKRFILYFKLYPPKEQGGKTGKDFAYVGMATSPTPTGPFKYQGRFLGADSETGSGDFAIYQDTDGAVYHIAVRKPDKGRKDKPLVCGRLSDDGLKPVGDYVAMAGVINATEGPALFRRAGKYYLLGSESTGWKPNPARLFVADQLTGPYRFLGNPCRGINPNNQLGPEKTFGGQSTFVFPLPGKPDEWIAMFDINNPSDPVNGGYIWLPLKFEDGKPVIEWRTEWSLESLSK